VISIGVIVTGVALGVLVAVSLFVIANPWTVVITADAEPELAQMVASDPAEVAIVQDPISIGVSGATAALATR